MLMLYNLVLFGIYCSSIFQRYSYKNNVTIVYIVIKKRTAELTVLRFLFGNKFYIV